MRRRNTAKFWKRRVFIYLIIWYFYFLKTYNGFTKILVKTTPSIKMQNEGMGVEGASFQGFVNDESL